MTKMSALLLLLIPGLANAAFTLQVDTAGNEIAGWNTSTVTFDINYTDCIAQGVTADQLNGAIDTALGVWNSTLTSSINLVRGSSVTTTAAQIKAQTSAGNPLILCDSSMAADSGISDTSNIPAAAQVLRVDSDYHIALAVIYINAEAGKATNVANIIDHSNLLEVVLAHEVGHAIGLGHATESPALMYYDASLKTELGLARDDVEGITYLYPRKELLGGDGLFGCGTLNSRRSPSGSGNGGGPLAVQFFGLLAFCGLVTAMMKRQSALNARLAHRVIFKCPLDTRLSRT
jgi:predicted Zn-dependent protease